MTEQLSQNTPVSSSVDAAPTDFKADSAIPPASFVTIEHCRSKNCIHKRRVEMEKISDKNKKKKKKNKHRKSRRAESESEYSDTEDSTSSSDSSESEQSISDSDSSSSEDEDSHRNKKKKKREASSISKVLKTSKKKKEESKPSKRSTKSTRKVKYDTEDDDSTSRDASIDSDGFANLKKQLESQGLLKSSKKRVNLLKDLLKLASRKDVSDDGGSTRSKKSERSAKSAKPPDKQDDRVNEENGKESSKARYKRLDEIWDENLFDYRLRETSDQKRSDEYEQYVFTVRRKFDIENHHQSTLVDIKSVPLVECLKIVMDGVQGISLVERNPKLAPDTLFLYLEDFRDYKEDLTANYRKCRVRKVRKGIKTKAKHLGILIDYLDRDYEDTKRTLYPMLANGTITFDLLWTLYKPNTLVYKSTYGDESVPRAFKIDFASKERNYVKGHFYDIEGKYLDFDGDNFGKAWINAEVPQFQGSRKITSLPCYPLHYHQKYEALKDQLIQRGKKFLRLAGMNYRFCKGTSYVKKDNKVLKVNVNSRVMIDPKTFRRINPNYLLCELEPKDAEDDGNECQCEKHIRQRADDEKQLFVIQKKDSKDENEVEIIELTPSDLKEHFSDLSDKNESAKLIFTEEELIVASPLVLGFCFNEKLWVELPVTEISDVQWNDGAFDSLVIPEKHKSIVKALVSAHGQHASKSIDDVVAGKGKGLVAVLHGKPGLGKTLTCEAVADLLKRPLYAVSAGDLGTSVTNLEIQLQMILDVAHTWGAVLLLDEADVFLEQRSLRDSHRNAMVSVMLRQLEYFCGILILTTNRVEIFDEAFVSRIHLSLRYGDLTAQARKTIWKTFINRVADTSDSVSTSTPSAALSETSSIGAPTPGTTSSTPNSGRATPAPPTEVIEHASSTATTSTSTPAPSIKSADSDQTVTPTTHESSQAADPSSTASPNVSSPPATEVFTEANFTELSRIDVNGRQIKNLVKTAQALALYEGVPMGMDHLRRCIEVGRSFELDLKGGRGWEDAMRSYT